MLKKLFITGFAFLLLTACGTEATEENASNANQESETPQINNHEKTQVKDTNIAPKTVDITNPTVSMEEAVNIFKEAHPDAKIESIDLDSDFGRLHYDIEGFDSSKEYEMEIDATTKEIKENEVENDRERDEALDFSTVIKPAKALEIASARTEVDGLSPTGWKLEADDGIQKYTVEYEDRDTEVDIKINATTEEILDVEMDD